MKALRMPFLLLLKKIGERMSHIGRKIQCHSQNDLALSHRAVPPTLLWRGMNLVGRVFSCHSDNDSVLKQLMPPTILWRGGIIHKQMGFF